MLFLLPDAIVYSERDLADQSIGGDLSVFYVHFDILHKNRIDVLDRFGYLCYGIADSIFNPFLGRSNHFYYFYYWHNILFLDYRNTAKRKPEFKCIVFEIIMIYK